MIKVIHIIAVCTLLVGCLPKDVRLPAGEDPSSSVQYTGFSGATLATTTGATKVKIKWTASSDSRVVAYNIYDSTFRFAPKLIKTVSAPDDNVTLTGLTSGQYYTFRVRAADEKNVEDANVSDIGAIPYGGILPAQVQTSTSAIIPYNDASNADQVNIYCKSGSDAYALVKTVSNVALLQSAITQLTPGTEYTCRAALQINGFVDNNTVETTFVPIGLATTLVFTTQPVSSAAGVNLPAQPVVTIKDANGNIVSAGPDSVVQVRLTVATTSPTQGLILGTSTVSAVAGVATFSGIHFEEAGDKVITATKQSTLGQTYGADVLVVDSNQFSISAGAVSPAHSTISISPAVPPNAALVANGNNSYTVSILLADQYGNVVQGVKPTFTSNIGGDTLTQPALQTDNTGIASGSITTTIADINPVRSLTINSPSGLNTVQTFAPFVAGAAAKLAYTVQPVNSPGGALGITSIKVAVEDAQGNVVTTGPAATALINVSIASNVNSATLSGTTNVAAVNGVAVFNDLGIDKTQTGYKLLASSGSYAPAYSNSFNITAGTPRKILISSPAATMAGQCSTAFTLQLQDLGGNPANAIQNTPIALSGLGAGQFFTSAVCGGSPLSSSITFTAGTNTKTLYMKDLKGELLSLSATDSSAVLSPGTATSKITPSQIAISASAPPPAAAGTPLKVVSGSCSSAIYITPAGENGQPAPLFSITPVVVSGVGGSSAALFSDPTCSTPVSASNVPLPVTYGTSFAIPVYLKDDKAETLNLNVADPSGMVTTSSLQTVQVVASKIIFTGPASVVAGKCSSAFTITLKDAAGNAVSAPQNTSLAITGLGSSGAQFYMTAACTGSGSNSTVTIPQNSATIQVYLSDNLAETLHIGLTDPGMQLANSATLTVGISPSALRIVAPGAGNSNTTVCAGPFTINTMDGANAVTAAITSINVTLTGAGLGGDFFTDNTCSTSVNTFTFANGESAKTFYYMGQYPATGLDFIVTDSAAVLTAGDVAWNVNAAPGWIGTQGTMFDANGNTVWFTPGVVPVAARVDGPSSAYQLHFDSSHNYLYVADQQSHRVLKYDYVNKKYIGWLGQFNSAAVGVTGSTLVTPSNAQCVATTSGNTLPGWCTGGFSQATSNNALGGMYSPTAVADDGTYIYVTQINGNTVTRYLAQTGAYAGYLGKIGTTPIAAGNGPNAGPGTCTSPVVSASGNPTPGWCMGGSSSNSGAAYVGNGLLNNPRAILYSSGYIYVSSAGVINKYAAADGSFQGWIGMVSTTPPTGGAAGCTTTGNNVKTPGWCVGGTYQAINPKSNGGGGISTATGMVVLNGVLYVVMGDNGGTISMYDEITGAYQGYMTNLSGNWQSPYQIVTDGTYFYIADWNRVIKIDQTGLVLGWMGKVANAASMSGNAGCSTLVPNANTPGFCLGGTSKHGMDDSAFNQATAVELDGNGSLITGQGATYPAIKQFNQATGTYVGTLAYKSTSPRQWSNDATAFAQYYGFDDYSMDRPAHMYNDGTYLYVAEYEASRIKKIEMATGKTIGWIGGITTTPTGGGAGCTSATPMGPSPNWCLGALFNPTYLWNYMINYTSNGIMNCVQGITGDGTYLYTTDYCQHRIQKWQLSNGAYVGWIGNINISPTGGPGSCVGAAVGTFTPGWCTGGMSTNGQGDGMLWNPAGITYSGGKLYVVDTGSNMRVSSYDATTGAFIGWIGRINAAPTVCTTATNSQYVVSTNNWCKGGSSQPANNGGDKGGGFYFSRVSGIASDGTYLYISNTSNSRIDKYNLQGVWQGALPARYDQYTGVWSNNPTVVGGYAGASPQALWTDANYIYGVGGASSSYGANAFKVNKTTGTVVGWKGTPRADLPPNGGDPGCAGATVITPGWCQGGGAAYGYQIGGFVNAYGISGDNNFIYVSDENNHRVTRLPK